MRGVGETDPIEIGKMWALADKNGDGTLSFGEWGAFSTNYNQNRLSCDPANGECCLAEGWWSDAWDTICNAAEDTWEAAKDVGGAVVDGLVAAGEVAGPILKGMGQVMGALNGNYYVACCT